MLKKYVIHIDFDYIIFYVAYTLTNKRYTQYYMSILDICIIIIFNTKIYQILINSKFIIVLNIKLTKY